MDCGEGGLEWKLVCSHVCMERLITSLGMTSAVGLGCCDLSPPQADTIVGETVEDMADRQLVGQGSNRDLPRFLT